MADDESGEPRRRQLLAVIAFTVSLVSGLIGVLVGQLTSDSTAGTCAGLAVCFAILALAGSKLSPPHIIPPRVSLTGGLVLAACFAGGAGWSASRPAPWTTEKIPFVVPGGLVSTGPVTIRQPEGLTGVCASNFSGADPHNTEAHQCRTRLGQKLQIGAADPCFAAPQFSGAVLCFDGPWKEEGKATIRALAISDFKMISLSNAPPRPSAWKRPWALELTNGHRCVTGLGANGVALDIEPTGVKYECFRPTRIFKKIDANLVGWLLDYPTETSKRWTVTFVARNGGGKEQPSKVRRSWE